jgi:uncharacterized protein (TIGR01319 family)
MTLPCVCLDVGSGWVKALGIDADGEPAGVATHRTTPEDLLVGVHAAVGASRGGGMGQVIAKGRPGGDTELLACSSAGGGLRLAVVGREELAATEAGYRVACSAGARLVHVQAGELEPAGVRAMRAARPDVVLLLGGSGRGRDAARVLLANAARLAKARVRAPIVLAATPALRADAAAVLSGTGRTVVTCDTVLPEPGLIVPEPARAAVVDLLERHQIGGRGSATTARFRRLARRSTTAAVRDGLSELLRLRGPDGGAVLLVDVGCSTTDVYSAGPVGRNGGCVTIEADLGMRATAAGILTEGQAQAVVDPMEADLLAPTATRLADDTGFLPEDSGAQAEDRRLAALAALLATRRHLRVAERSLRETGVGLVVLTGGVFRQPDSAGLAAVRDTLRGDTVLRGVLEDCPIAVDDGFALAPAGLLAAAGHTETARMVLDTAIAPDG